MSRQNLSRADQLFAGRVTYSPYQADRPGIAVSLSTRWKPTGTLAITFTAGLAAGATAGTLSGAFAGPSGLYPITFSDTEVLTGLFTASNTAVKFYPASPAVIGGGYGVAVTGGIGGTAQAPLVNAVTSAATVSGQPPALGVSTDVAASQSITTGTPGLVNGARASGGVATMDVPRNIIAAWTGTAILTVTGTDYYGVPQTEVSASGTSFTGKKGFATITGISVSANVTVFTSGTGNVLALPFRVASGGISCPMFNDAVDAGTFVPPDLTMPATSSTGDVRGTYAPAGTLNGAKFLAILLRAVDNTTQVGSFGVTPA
jgi:hypothetical protein